MHRILRSFGGLVGWEGGQSSTIEVPAGLGLAEASSSCRQLASYYHHRSADTHNYNSTRTLRTEFEPRRTEEGIQKHDLQPSSGDQMVALANLANHINNGELRRQNEPVLGQADPQSPSRSSGGEKEPWISASEAQRRELLAPRLWQSLRRSISTDRIRIGSHGRQSQVRFPSSNLTHKD